MNDEIPQRRKTDGAFHQWFALTISTLIALGGTAAFTFRVYDNIRVELARVALLEPTLRAHIQTDGDLQRICQERVDYIERRLDTLSQKITK